MQSIAHRLHYEKTGMEKRPDLTPLGLAEAKCNVTLAAIEFANVAQELHHKIASQRLALLEKRRVGIADLEIESVISAPIG